MKLLIINSVIGYGSTGRIVLDIAEKYEKNGFKVKIAYGRKFKSSKETGADIRKYGMRIGTTADIYGHILYTRLTDKHGLASKQATKRFLKWAENYNPDVLWLHNIHGYFINYELLFKWIKAHPQMQVKWTLHDCWAFTGHCSYFTYIKCDKWQTGCYKCPQLSQYPSSITDACSDNYNRKKAAFNGVSNLTIITPSNWLKEKVQQSFLSEYSVTVKYNTINTDVFKPTSSTFKQDHNIQDKKMILGVASAWEKRKGLNDFIELSQQLDNKEYKIVLVGLNTRQIKDIKKRHLNILCIPRTDSAQELARIYSAAEVFVNPSYEETFGLTTYEAQACGTYSIVYENTACAEIINKNNGEVIRQGVDYIENAIYHRFDQYLKK